ncbi:hypothetical protein Y10_27200 [Neptunitalea sp. Y10]|uniref:Uncharacterized protein n=1 Tax=Neptunitalea lumnitzerae TaxID=2965509 RepID=A0ABQ5MN02_9FLAO|nr:hypothetical protein Y10_27200 [Neptunitalea sp. Y10]
MFVFRMIWISLGALLSIRVKEKHVFVHFVLTQIEDSRDLKTIRMYELKRTKKSRFTIKT